MSRLENKNIITNKIKIETSQLKKICYFFSKDFTASQTANKLNISRQTINSYYKIFREISKVVGFAVSPHSLRHTWNDRFSKYADKRIAENKTTEAKADSDQRKLAGWTANSKEIGRYTKRTRDNRAMMVGLELQEKHSSEVSKIVGQYDEDLPF